MTMQLLPALVAFAFVTSITPGPNNLMLMTSGANFGWTRTIPHMLGVGIGFTVMIVLIGAGLIQVFELWPLTHTILKIASVLFLAYLAWKIANAAPPAAAQDETGTPLTFLQASLFQWVNPKAWAMALSAIGAYRPEGSGLIGAFLVAVVFGLVNIPSISCWVMLGTQLRRLLNVPWKLRAFNFTAAALLLASLYPILMPH
jgi:threonine/homoserine/homoserine lactone efflux protein